MCIKLRLPPRGDRERVQQHLEFVEPPRVRVVVRVVRVVGQDALGDAARRRLADGKRRDAVGDSHDYTLTMRKVYAETLYKADGASLDDLREAVTTLEDTARIARRVLGGEHPLTTGVEKTLGKSRAAYDTRRGVLEALAGGHGVDLAALRQTYRA